MPFVVDYEQEQLQASVRSLLARHTSARGIDVPAGVESVEVQGQLWTRMNEQFDLAWLGVAEDRGGYGSIVEAGIVQHELGRHLLLVPYFPTLCMVARFLCLMRGREMAVVYLQRIAAGQTAAFAYLEAGRGHEISSAETDARQDDSGTWRLKGCKEAVLGGAAADFILVTAATPEGTAVFAVEANAPGVARESTAAIDPSLEVARCSLHDAEAVLLAEGGESATALTLMLAQASVLLGAFQVGAAAACFDRMRKHLVVREQFNRRLVDNQVVRHTLADLAITLEGAISAAYYGLWSASVHDVEEVDEVADIVAITCSRVAQRLADSNVHFHGALGFTWEHSSHWFHKRAMFTENLLGHRGMRLERQRARIFSASSSE